MRIDSAIKAYTDPALNGTGRVRNVRTESKEKTGSIKENGDLLNLSIENPNNLITKRERQFFVRMFPENSVRIQNHILFNRNGKTLNQNLDKGLIIDGRV